MSITPNNCSALSNVSPENSNHSFGEDSQEPFNLFKNTIVSAERSIVQSRIDPNYNFGAELVNDPTNGGKFLDKNGTPVSVSKMLATKPLRGDLCARPGPGNKQLTYISGDSVTRTLNEIFGFDGWCMEVRSTSKEECEKDDKGRYHVTYIAFVRLIHRRSGSFREDCGSGDSIDRSLGVAISNALKASVTDAMKRAARHFGDKLGNSLYQGSFSIKKAPVTLQKAVEMYELEQCQSKNSMSIKSEAAHQDQNKGMNNRRLLPPADNTENIGESTFDGSSIKENATPHRPKLPVQHSGKQSSHPNMSARPSSVNGSSDPRNSLKNSTVVNPSNHNYESEKSVQSASNLMTHQKMDDRYPLRPVDLNTVRVETSQFIAKINSSESQLPSFNVIDPNGQNKSFCYSSYGLNRSGNQTTSHSLNTEARAQSTQNQPSMTGGIIKRKYSLEQPSKDMKKKHALVNPYYAQNMKMQKN